MSEKTSDTQDQPTETPHYHGHRERLRERFQSAGPDALSDYELLEMVLFTAQPRSDMKPLAKSLLKTFGSFAEVIHAPEARLREVKGIGERDDHRIQADRGGGTAASPRASCKSAPCCRRGTM